jgi:hypothetical protein
VLFTIKVADHVRRCTGVKGSNMSEHIAAVLIHSLTLWQKHSEEADS